ncbi:hypothetical protein HYY69_08000 [Candidatus Woesearchaeota archaeon]|nr:hypothetical protein [Candidatus Woesearchaeota archaeon]
MHLLPQNYGPVVQPVYAVPRKKSSYSIGARFHQSKRTQTTEITLEVALQQELDQVKQIIRYHKKQTITEESLDVVLAKHDLPEKVIIEQIPSSDYKTMEVNVYALPSPQHKPEQIASYNLSLQEYQEQRRDDIADTTRFLPVKHRIFEQMPEGLFGYTFIGSDKVYINQSLVGGRKEETIVHESIHTPDEYETRVITSWILHKETNKYMMKGMVMHKQEK